MTEENIITPSVAPQTGDEASINADTTPTECKEEFFVPVKFNREVKNLSVPEAAVLAQKGMKFDLISKDFECLKELAAREGESIPQFLQNLKSATRDKRLSELTEKCSGDTEFAKKVLELEQNGCLQDNGFDEVRKAFPHIKSAENLPPKVLEAAALKGTLLLDEYLRYRLQKSLEEKEQLRFEKGAERMSIGSQQSKSGGNSPETEEFLKGLWR